MGRRCLLDVYFGEYVEFFHESCEENCMFSSDCGCFPPGSLEMTFDLVWGDANVSGVPVTP